MATRGTDLATTLTQLRKRSGLSLRGLEDASGVDRSTISRIENGEYQQPSPSNLTKLAAGLGVDASKLLTAAGYTASQADALPSMRVYLRTKYGHLTADERERLADMLDELEASRSSGRSKPPSQATKKRKTTNERRS
jgi:HTH-type transcriptional regulator, competence development regulator